jgi:DNA-binding protein
VEQVIVGTSKPILNYVTACITLFNRGEKQITIRARGKAINAAVEVLQMLQTHFMKEVVVADAKIDREFVLAHDGRRLSLPVLELILSR